MLSRTMAYVKSEAFSSPGERTWGTSILSQFLLGSSRTGVGDLGFVALVSICIIWVWEQAGLG